MLKYIRLILGEKMLEAYVFREIMKSKIGDEEEPETQEQRKLRIRAERKEAIIDKKSSDKWEAENLKFKTERPNAYRMNKFLDIGKTAGAVLGFIAGPIAVFQTAGLGMAPIIGAGVALAISPVLGAVIGVVAVGSLAVVAAKGIEYLSEDKDNAFKLPNLTCSLSKIKEIRDSSIEVSNKNKIKLV
jgi:hypothetical protein